MLKIPFAIRNDVPDTFVTPDSALRGDDWVCPNCRHSVVLKKGPIKVAHFAHRAAVSSSTCGGGESFLHKCTKEWIAKHVGLSSFSVCSKCTDCKGEVTIFRGGSQFFGRCEIPFGGKLGSSNRQREFRADVMVIHRVSRRVVAVIEVRHTHATEIRKLQYADGLTEQGAMEVKAEDLTERNYPTVFCDLRKRVCRPCLRIRIQRKCTQMLAAREKAVQRCFQKWVRFTSNQKKEREVKFARRWLFLHRAPQLVNLVRGALDTLRALQFQPCFKCGSSVQKFTWQAYKIPGEKCNRFRQVRLDHDEVEGNAYHLGCSPLCQVCGEWATNGRWCQCEKARRKKCDDCSAWQLTDRMFCFPLPCGKNSWVCLSCGVPCGKCERLISRQQATYGGKCYECNVRARNLRMGVAEMKGLCRLCGTGIRGQYSECYSCHFGSR